MTNKLENILVGRRTSERSADCLDGHLIVSESFGWQRHCENYIGVPRHVLEPAAELSRKQLDQICVGVETVADGNLIIWYYERQSEFELHADRLPAGMETELTAEQWAAYGDSHVR